MTPTDGKIVGTMQILDNGPATQRWNLVIMGDGYRAAELDQFATHVESFVATLLATPPFDRLQRAMNVFRIDVESTDSGAADPDFCEGGTGAAPATYFDARFCGFGGIRRLLVVNEETALHAAAAQVPQFHMAMVMVNSTIYGGSGGPVAVLSRAAGAEEIALHEMGHTAFKLTDEYSTWEGCGVDYGREMHPPEEPAAANATIESDRATIKWRDLILPTTPVPTTRNADCTNCDPQPSPVPGDVIGAFEGADYYHCGAFRPAFNCRMRALRNPYCGVCAAEIGRTLSAFMP